MNFFAFKNINLMHAGFSEEKPTKKISKQFEVFYMSEDEEKQLKACDVAEYLQKKGVDVHSIEIC
jgi:hypothetical protein